MARFNEINVGRFNSLLSRLLQIKGPPPSPQLNPDIHPVLVLEHDRPEWHILSGARVGIFGINLAALAANLSAWQLFNPSSSGVISIIEEWWVSVSVTDVVQLIRRDVRDNPSLTALGTLDTRTKAQVLATISDQQQAAAINQDFLMGSSRVLANTMIKVAGPLILAPGTGVKVMPITVNQALTGWVRIRERALEESELPSA